MLSTQCFPQDLKTIFRPYILPPHLSSTPFLLPSHAYSFLSSQTSDQPYPIPLHSIFKPAFFFIKLFSFTTSSSNYFHLPFLYQIAPVCHFLRNFFLLFFLIKRRFAISSLNPLIPLFVNTSPEEAKIYFRSGNYYPSDLELIYVSHKDIIDVDGPYDICKVSLKGQDKSRSFYWIPKECFDYFVYKNLFKPE